MSHITAVAALAINEGDWPRSPLCQARVLKRLNSKCGQERTYIGGPGFREVGRQVGVSIM